MLLSNDEIQRLITDAQPLVCKPPEHHATGPGRLNLYALQEGRKHVWTREKAQQAEPRPTFIICCREIIRYAPDETTLGFISSLLNNNYSILLWMGLDVAVDDMPLCQSITDLLDKVKEMKLSPAYEVKQHLVAHNKQSKII